MLVAGCAGSTSTTRGAPPFDRDAATHAVALVLDDWHDAAAHADESRYFGHFTSDGVFLGTDATERWDVAAFRAYAHPHFARGRAWAFRAVERHVVIRDANLAWFDERLATERLGDARGSGVLVRDAGGTWRIAQYNLSLTIPNERFDAVRRLLESSSGPATTSSSAAPTGASPSPAADTGCDPANQPARLTAYDAIRPGLRFTLDLVEDARSVWVPAERLTMPMHHASEIVWEHNEPLASHHGGRVRIVAVGIGRRRLDHDPRRNTWFASYAATIETVCPAR